MMGSYKPTTGEGENETGKRQMREIKFRVWCHMEKAMVSDVKLLQDTFDMSVRGNLFTLAMRTDRRVLMQFTGLLDKNGVEIYEGDILPMRYGIDNGIVVWEEGDCSFDVVDGLGDDFTAGEHLLDLTGPNDLGYNPWEVLGNIYENPNLI